MARRTMLAAACALLLLSIQHGFMEAASIKPAPAPAPTLGQVMLPGNFAAVMYVNNSAIAGAPGAALAPSSASNPIPATPVPNFGSPALAPMWAMGAYDDAGMTFPVEDNGSANVLATDDDDEPGLESEEAEEDPVSMWNDTSSGGRRLQAAAKCGAGLAGPFTSCTTGKASAFCCRSGQSRCAAECRQHVNKCCSPATCPRGEAGPFAACSGSGSFCCANPRAGRGCSNGKNICRPPHQAPRPPQQVPCPGDLTGPWNSCSGGGAPFCCHRGFKRSCSGGKNACTSARGYTTCKAGYNGPYGCGNSPDLAPEYCCPDGTFGPTLNCNCIQNSKKIISNVGNIGSQPDSKPSNCFGLCG